MTSATIVYNPAARKAPSLPRLEKAARALRAEGCEIELRPTEYPGHATRIAAESALSGNDAVFACGGDGTVNEVVNGLAGTECALGLVRGGMGNVFAKEIGAPRDPEEALRWLLTAERRRFDLGMAGSRYFLLMAGVGFDAAVVRRVPRGPKRILGSVSYLFWGALELGRHRSRPVDLEIEGVAQTADLYWLLLGNTRSYGGVVDIAREARVDDGLLDAYVFAGRGPGWVLSTGLRTALRLHQGSNGVSFHRVQQLSIITAGIPIQADGEDFGETPLRFSVSPAALSVLVQPDRAGQLFS